MKDCLKPLILRGKKRFCYDRYYNKGYCKNNKKFGSNLNAFGFFLEKP